MQKRTKKVQNSLYSLIFLQFWYWRYNFDRCNEGQGYHLAFDLRLGLFWNCLWPNLAFLFLGIRQPSMSAFKLIKRRSLGFKQYIFKSNCFMTNWNLLSVLIGPVKNFHFVWTFEGFLVRIFVPAQIIVILCFFLFVFTFAMECWRSTVKTLQWLWATANIIDYL
jgi:hypothetical protein